MDKNFLSLLPLLMNNGESNNQQIMNMLFSSMGNKADTNNNSNQTINPMMTALLANMMNGSKNTNNANSTNNTNGTDTTNTTNTNTNNNKNNMMEMFTKMMNNKDIPSDNQANYDLPTMLSSLFRPNAEMNNQSANKFRPIEKISNEKINQLLLNLMKQTS